VVNSAAPPLVVIQVDAKGPRMAAEAGPLVSGAREQIANPELATSVRQF